MAGLAILNGLLKLENMFCVFRNFSYLKKGTRYVAVTCAVMELIINMAFIYICLKPLFVNSVNMDNLFMIQFRLLFNMNSVLVIFLGFKNAHSFKALCSEIYVTYDVLKNNMALQKSLNKAKRFSLILTVVYLCNYMTMLMFYLKDFYVYSKNKYSSAEVYLFLTDIFFLICSEVRFFTEFLSIIVFIRILHTFLKNIHLEITKTINTLTLRKDSMESTTFIEKDRILNNVDTWFSTIRNFNKCCFYIKHCYSFQVSTSISIF